MRKKMHQTINTNTTLDTIDPTVEQISIVGKTILYIKNLQTENRLYIDCAAEATMVIHKLFGKIIASTKSLKTALSMSNIETVSIDSEENTYLSGPFQIDTEKLLLDSEEDFDMPNTNHKHVSPWMSELNIGQPAF